jgi:hypothetical protein
MHKKREQTNLVRLDKSRSAFAWMTVAQPIVATEPASSISSSNTPLTVAAGFTLVP